MNFGELQTPTDKALYRELFVRRIGHAIVSSHFGQRMKVRGRLFGLAKSPFDA